MEEHVTLGSKICGSLQSTVPVVAQGGQKWEVERRAARNMSDCLVVKSQLALLSNWHWQIMFPRCISSHFFYLFSSFVEEFL